MILHTLIEVVSMWYLSWYQCGIKSKIIFLSFLDFFVCFFCIIKIKTKKMQKKQTENYKKPKNSCLLLLVSVWYLFAKNWYLLIKIMVSHWYHISIKIIPKISFFLTHWYLYGIFIGIWYLSRFRNLVSAVAMN